MDILEPTIITDGGPWANHNMPCPVDYCQKEFAVIELETGIFMPGWKAQERGWMLVKCPKWLHWFFRYFEPPFVTRRRGK